MFERDHPAQIGALQDTVQSVESDVLTLIAAFSKSGAVDQIANFSEPSSIKSRLKDLEQEVALLPL
jgi:hypothetical protein